MSDRTQARLSGGALSLSGCVAFEGLDEALTAEPDAAGVGAFLVARAPATSSRLTLSAGRIPGLERYTACHRYEPYWMKPASGRREVDVPEETQFLLASLASGDWLLVATLIDDDCRSSLRGHPEGRLELLIETGDPHLGTAGGQSLFVAVGRDPFSLCERSAEAVAGRLGSGPLRRDKPVPDFVDRLGWCTWDAFYQEVTEQKVLDGLARFAAGGVQPGFLILDDGWQSVRRMPTGEKRLTALAPNDKFGGDLAPLVRRAKQEYGIETFLVWHAMVGYWGGIDGEALPDYGVVDVPRRFGEGILAHLPRFNEDWWGGLVGLVPPDGVRRFYDDYHRSLAAQGVDGVKVDSQAVIEALAARQGGRVKLSRAYREALEASVVEHFSGRLINCMANGQETYFGSPRSTLTRSSIDFFPTRPESHGAHLYANAQVGLFFGQFMLPDWDMFQSGHLWGAFHAAGRAISGGPVYVSDKPGEHDFELLRKLVCSDGRVLRCDQPGLPTLDTLAADPTVEPGLLKIWNRNGEAGFLGAFHALYAGDGESRSVSGVVRPSDVVGLEGGPFACFAQVAGTLERLDASEERTLTLQERQWELFTFVPVVDGFAAIGLADKLNSSAALASSERVAGGFRLRVRDGGSLLAYCECSPASVTLDGRPIEFSHDAAGHRLSVALPHAGDVVITA